MRAKNFITKEGRKALKEVAVWLEEGGEHKGVRYFAMNTWFAENYRPKMGAKCGTACCIAGAVAAFNDLSTNEDRVMAVAGKFLGITQDHQYNLFVPNIYIGEDYELNLSDVKAKHAARVIRRFLRTGEVNWKKTMKKDEYKKVMAEDGYDRHGNIKIG